MNKSWVAVLSATAVGALVASAADYTWVGETADWSGAGNWSVSEQPSDWMDGNNAIFDDTGKTKAVTLGSNVSASLVHVQDDYSFVGPGSLLLNGYFKVNAGKTATFAAMLKQDATVAQNRLIKGNDGTLVLTGDVSAYRFQNDGGTTRLNGATMNVTGPSSGATASSAAFAMTKGAFVVDGAARFKLTATSSYCPISGGNLYVTNGVFDVFNAGETLLAFNDNNSAAIPDCNVIIADKGEFIGKKIRLSKASKAQVDSGRYGHINLEKGGKLRAVEFTMDGNSGPKTNYFAQINFNGGELVLTNTSSTANSPFGNGDIEPFKWGGVNLSVKEGGAYITSVMSTKTLKRGFTSGAAHDGGLHVKGSNIFYMSATNTFNGGTWLEGAVTYVPLYDESFGAVPPEPTNNIFITSSSPVLHFDYERHVHKNRNVLISSNVTMQVGNGQDMHLHGTISTAGADPAASVLKAVDNWTGFLDLAPADNRTNVVGRLEVRGKVRVSDGVTRVIRNTAGTTGSGAALYVGGKTNGYKFVETRGLLEVTGGELKVEKNVYVFMENYGQLRVSGGKLNVAATKELLNGMNTPTLTEVSGSGEIETLIMRISQVSPNQPFTFDADGLPAARVHVATGGVLRTTKFYIDSNSVRVGRLDLDGGTVASRAARTSEDDFLGEKMSNSRYANWAQIQVRVCEGGAIFDTTKGAVTVNLPVISGATKDGGFRKVGANNLTLRCANTWNGPTRVDNGTLTLQHVDGFPGGDIEISVAALNKGNARQYAMIAANRLNFKPGAKIRVVDTEGVTPETFGRKVILASSSNPIASVPPVVVVDKDGNETSGGWEVRLSADGKTLTFGVERGLQIILR